MISKSRILALDIRISRFGYAVFEIPAKVLAFGVSTADSPPKVRERISTLIRQFRPSVIVLRKLASQTKRDRYQHGATARIFRKEAQSASIPVEYVSEAAFKNFFRNTGAQNKYEIAALVAEWFPDLAWKLPPRRKVYKPEPWTMSLLDAAALGAAYLASKGLHTSGVKQ
jgi:hypothetical protein